MTNPILPQLLPFFRRIALFVIFTMSTGVGLEAFLAATSLFTDLPFPRPSYDRTFVNRKSLHADINPVFGVWHQRNYRARQTGPCFDAMFTTNRWGARDDSWMPTPGMPRGILLGDSYMEGYGVNEKERASEIFEQATDTKLLNLAVAGHCGPTQYRLIYETFKDSLAHDFVLVGLNLPNELDDEDISKWKTRKRYRPYLEGTYPDYKLTYATVPLKRSVYASQKTKPSLAKNFLSEYSSLYHCITYIMDHGPSPSEHLEGRLINKLPRRKFNRESALKVVYNVERIQRLAGNKPVYVFFVPNLSFFEDNNNPAFIFIREHLQEKKIRILDLHRYLTKQNAPKLFLECDVHWNVAGNARVGEALGAAFSNFRTGSNLRAAREQKSK